MPSEHYTNGIRKPNPNHQTYSFPFSRVRFYSFCLIQADGSFSVPHAGRRRKQASFNNFIPRGIKGPAGSSRVSSRVCGMPCLFLGGTRFPTSGRSGGGALFLRPAPGMLLRGCTSAHHLRTLWKMLKVPRLLLALSLLALAGSRPAIPVQLAATGDPLSDTAPELRDFWLRFHEVDLCQGLDTVFVFRPTGVEIWCVVDDERNFEKLSELLAPLRSKFQIAVYPTRPQPEKKSPEDRNPPPSLWNNEELRTFLTDPFVGAMNPPGDSISRTRPLSTTESDVLKQRMIMFAEETLDWDKRLKRYAADLPALAHLATASSLSPETRARASSICLAHAQAVDRLAGHLGDNLSQAVPNGAKRPKSAAEADRSDARKLPLVESSQELSNSALAVARRVYRFIHPQKHTVGLVDLRESSLLEALRSLRRMAAGFERSLSPNFQ